MPPPGDESHPTHPTPEDVLSTLRDVEGVRALDPAAPLDELGGRRQRARVVRTLIEHYTAGLFERDVEDEARRIQREDGRAMTVRELAEMIAARAGAMPHAPPRACWRCGYALAALEAAICPECGWTWAGAS